MIHRRRRNRGFFQMSNQPAQDKHLSLQAKGLLAVMMCRPEDWRFTMSWLEEQSSNGSHAHQQALLELERNGYVVRGQRRGEGNRITAVEWIVDDEPMDTAQVLTEYGLTPLPRAKIPKTDVPDTGIPDGGFSVTGKSVTEKSPTTNTVSSQTRVDKEPPLPPAGAEEVPRSGLGNEGDTPGSDAAVRQPDSVRGPHDAGKTRTGGKDVPGAAARKKWEEFKAYTLTETGEGVPDWVNEKQFLRWLKDLCERRIKITTGRIEAQLEKLEALFRAGETQEAIITRAIAGGWQSFYPERGGAGNASEQRGNDQYSRYR